MSNKNYTFDNDKVYDKKSIYICTGQASQQQVENIFMIIGQNLNIDSNFIINVILTREGECTGCGYAYISNPDFYHALTGDNLDGTKRIILKDNPRWVAPELPLDEALQQLELEQQQKCIDGDHHDDWPLLAKFEDDRKHLISSYQCNKIECYEGSLIKDEWLEYTFVDENNVSITKSIELHKAYVMDSDIEYNAMLSIGVPDWLTVNQVRDEFNPYTNGQIIRNGRFKGTLYPIIYIREPRPNNVNDNRNLYVCFNPNNYDCAFIKNMTRRIVIINPETNKPVILIFKAIKSQGIPHTINPNKYESSPDNNEVARNNNRNKYKNSKHLSSSDEINNKGNNIERPRSRNKYNNSKHLSSSNGHVLPRTKSDGN